MKNNHSPLVLKRFEPFFSEQYGIINQYYTVPLAPHMPKLFYGSGKLAGLSLFSGQSMDFSVGGCGEHPDYALMASFGEALERYSSSIVPVKKIQYGTYKELAARGRQILPPCTFKLFSPGQYKDRDFPLKVFNEESFLGWSQAKSLISGQKYLVPSSFLYFPYPFGKGEAHVNHITTTGLAFGFSRENAYLSGLCEVIERDCFALTWFTKLTPPRVDFKNTDCTSINRLLSKGLKGFEDKITILDMTLDLNIPAFLGFLETGDETDTLPAVCFGAAAHPDKETALYKTLIEVAQTYTFAWHLKNENNTMKKVTFKGNYRDEIINFDRGVLFYSYRENLEKIAFLKKNRSLKSFADIRDFKRSSVRKSVEAVLGQLNKKGYEALGSDITSIDVRSAGGYVCRSLIPGLMPLNGSYRYCHLGNPRLYEVPATMSYYTKPPGGIRINRDPHPFP